MKMIYLLTGDKIPLIMFNNGITLLSLFGIIISLDKFTESFFSPEHTIYLLKIGNGICHYLYQQRH